MVDALIGEAVELAEALRALVESRRNGVAGSARSQEPSASRALGEALQTSRATTRVCACMAWLLARRAAQRGELDQATAASDRFRLLRCAEPGERHGADVSGDDALLVTLSARVDHFYERIDRLDRVMRA